jgi:5'-3' exonuclease
MMTKYQLVFIKLETSMYKILANIDTRKKIRMRKALYKFKSNAFASTNKVANKKKYIIEKFRTNLEKLVSLYSAKQ